MMNRQNGEKKVYVVRSKVMVKKHFLVTRMRPIPTISSVPRSSANDKNLNVIIG